MSVEMKPGRWRERGGGVAKVLHPDRPKSRCPWYGINSTGWPSVWADDGAYVPWGSESEHDLVEYLGPLEEKM